MNAIRVALLALALAPAAWAASEPDTPTQLDPLEVEGKRSVMDSDRSRLEKLVPCIGVECDGERKAIAEKESLAERLLGALQYPMAFAEPDVEAPLKNPTKVRLDAKLP